MADTLLPGLFILIEMTILKKIFFTILIIHTATYLGACPVCRGGISQTEQDAYLLTIIILGSLPLLMAGALAVLIYKKYKRADKI